MNLNSYIWLLACIIYIIIHILEDKYLLISKIKSWWHSLECDSYSKYLHPSTSFIRRTHPLSWHQVFFRDKKAVITTIISIITIIILISSTFGYDKTFNESIGTNSLPTSGSYDLDFTVKTNETLYFNVTSKSEKLDINIPNSYYLNNTDTYKLIINWSVDKIIFTDDEILASEILVTNSLTSKNYSIGVIIDVLKEEKKVFDIISTSSNVIYHDNAFYKNISILHDFPSKDNIVINLEGEPNEIFTISGCDDDWFLACRNSSFNLNNEGKYQLKVPFRMEYTPIGLYNETFYLKSSSKNFTLKAVFSVLQPTFRLNYNNIEGCKNYDQLSFVKQMNCTESLLKYELEGIMQINEYFSKVNTENVCKNFIQTEYIVGDSISKEILDRNIELSLDNGKIRETNSLLSTKLDTCLQEKNNVILESRNNNIENNKSIIELKNDNTRTRLTLKEQYDIKTQESNNNTLFWLKIVCFFIFISFLIVIGLKYWYENMFATNIKINQYVFGCISLFFFILWVSLFFWG